MVRERSSNVLPWTRPPAEVRQRLGTPAGSSRADRPTVEMSNHDLMVICPGMDGRPARTAPHTLAWRLAGPPRRPDHRPGTWTCCSAARRVIAAILLHP